MPGCVTCGGVKPKGRGRRFCSEACRLKEDRRIAKERREPRRAAFAKFKEAIQCQHPHCETMKFAALLAADCKRHGMEISSVPTHAGYRLDFHHRDPKKKKCRITATNYTSPSGLAEIPKCILLCKNCHADYHWAMRQTPKEELDKILAPL